MELKSTYKTDFALLNLIDREPEELWAKIRNIIMEEYNKNNVKSRKEWKSKMDDRRNIEIVWYSREAKTKLTKAGLESWA